MTDRFQVGTVAGTHGIKGDIRVFPTTDDRSRFYKLKKVYVEIDGRERKLTVSNVRMQAKFVLMHLSGYDTPEDARMLLRKSLMIGREDLMPLPEGRYYIADLIGLRVITDEDCELGILNDVIRTGANDVYSVRTPEGKDVLIPVIRDCILDVQPEEGYIRVHLLPGLLDL